ncbi:MAG TPA: hypothetical protein PLI89_12650 [Chitinophagales bacterium]|nr:hypothetical protein [Chitinophagales bacterium]
MNIMDIITRAVNVKASIQQVLSDMPLGFGTATIYGFFQPFMDAEADFLIWLTVLLISDMVIGMYKHLRKGTLRIDGVGKVFDKIVVSFGVMVIVAFAQKWGAGEGYFGGFFEDGAQFTLLWWIGLSIAENIYVVSGEKYPPKAWIETIRSISLRKTGQGGNTTDENRE